jgi:phospholipid/cholesterol/gamma-HCH transport system substrate-binding protein
MKKITKEVKIGVISIFSILLLYYGINYLKGINLLKPANYYYLNLHDVTGLTVSSPVYIDGYKAGLVRSFDYDYEHPGNIIVEIAMNKELRISKGSEAEYKSDMLGTAAINLRLNYKGDQYYHPGDTLPSTLAQRLLDKIERDMLPRFTQVMMNLDAVLVSLNKVISNPALNKSVDNIQETTNELNKSAVVLTDMMRKDMPQIMTNLHTVSKDFSTVSGNLKNIDFAHTVSTVDSTLTNLKTLTSQLNTPNNTLGMLLKDRVLYDSLATAASSANQLILDLKAHPKRYVHFSVFGRK